MQVPVRVLLAARPAVPVSLLVGIASSTVVFTSTPFLLPAVAKSLEVSVGAASWISTMQLGGFVLASWFAGRVLHPVRSTFIACFAIGAGANLASAVAPTLLLLSLAAMASGVSLGLAAWFAWQAAFGDTAKTGDVAVIGPIVGTIAAPAVALLIEQLGVHWFYVILAGITASPLLFVLRIPTTAPTQARQQRHAPTRAAFVILVALGLLTLGGSSVFIFAAAIGKSDAGLSPTVVALLFSANALVGIPSARWQGRRGPAGVWFAATGACAVLVASTGGATVAFAVGLVAWGFMFWMGVPAAFVLLASRSKYPSERAGDAQAVMALGRVFGPLLGGALFAHGSIATLGGVAAGLMCAAAVMMLYIDRRTLPFIGQRLT